MAFRCQACLADFEVLQQLLDHIHSSIDISFCRRSWPRQGRKGRYKKLPVFLVTMSRPEHPRSTRPSMAGVSVAWSSVVIVWVAFGPLPSACENPSAKTMMDFMRGASKQAAGQVDGWLRRVASVLPTVACECNVTQART